MHYVPARQTNVLHGWRAERDYDSSLRLRRHSTGRTQRRRRVAVLAADGEVLPCWLAAPAGLEPATTPVRPPRRPSSPRPGIYLAWCHGAIVKYPPTQVVPAEGLEPPAVILEGCRSIR